ncbi:MAG: hypothetical protein QOJ12_2157, partial [Thermoleophilales bacterium]|nr:hypothetical protein [Thermoleophilales bacterium]
YSVLGKGLPAVPVSSLRFKPGDPDLLYVATFGRGAYTYRFGAEDHRCAASLRTAGAEPGATATPAGGPPSTGAAAPCPKSPRLDYRLHAGKGDRVVRADVYVGRRRVRTLRGRNLRTVGIARPDLEAFTVKVVTTTRSGPRTTSQRTYRGCTRSKVRHRTKRPRRRR